MTKLAWVLALVTVISLPSIGLTQYPAGQQASATRSVLRSAEGVHWTNFHAGTVAGHHGCATHTGCAKPICYGYDNCCPPPPLLCCLKRIARTLDCLLPCGCFQPCKFWGDCRPHFFLGGRCCGSNLGSGDSCSIGCSTPIGQPQYGDPFIDDPLPPMPTPTPATDVYHYAPRKSPYKVSTSQEVARQRAVEATARRSPPPSQPRDRVAQHTGSQSLASEQSVLRRTTLAEPAPASAPKAKAPSTSEPALLPVAIRRTSAEFTVDGLDIPVNPLRRQ
jgi:hypothetical protein